MSEGVGGVNGHADGHVYWEASACCTTDASFFYRLPVSHLPVIHPLVALSLFFFLALLF